VFANAGEEYARISFLTNTGELEERWKSWEGHTTLFSKGVLPRFWPQAAIYLTCSPPWRTRIPTAPHRWVGMF